VADYAEAAGEEAGAREGTWLWPCHIDLSATYRPVWEFFEPIVRRYDATIFTAAESVQPGVAGGEVALIPPSIDPLSSKNAEMSPGMVLEIAKTAWRPPAATADHAGVAVRPVEGPSRGDRRRPGRPSRRDRGPAGDDRLAGARRPEGMRYLELTAQHAGDEPDIHLLTNLDGVGDSEVNAVQRLADVVIQNLVRGISEGAEAIVQLLREAGLCDEMGAAGRALVRERFLSIRELEDHVRLMGRLS
jgi:trehalose synthase